MKLIQKCNNTPASRRHDPDEMLSHTNRVKAIKSRFESLNDENAKPKLTRKPNFQGARTFGNENSPPSHSKSQNWSNNIRAYENKHSKVASLEATHLYKQASFAQGNFECPLTKVTYNEDLQVNEDTNNIKKTTESSDSEEEQLCPKANNSYLYSKIDTRQSLSRQSSDPGKKLHRSHAFRGERSQILKSPKRHSSCSGRASMAEAPTLRIGEKPKLSQDRLKKLGNLLEDRMRKEHYVASNIAIDNSEASLFRIVPKKEYDDERKAEETSSTPDEEVPKHILDQYAKVFKQKKKAANSPSDEIKNDLMTDSGVSSETEVQENESDKGGVKKLRAHFETNVILNKTEFSDNNENFETNVESNLGKSEITASTETIRRIEKKNPNIILTDTLKKALKQPLPAGPPPKKPPRIFANIREDSIPNSPEFSPKPDRKLDHSVTNTAKKSKKETKLMLEKLERALQQSESKTIASRNVNIYDIAEDNDSSNEEMPKKCVKRKEIHYLCTEVLDIAQRTIFNSSGDSNITNSLSNCFNSLNCSVPNRSSSSIAYAKLNSGPNSSRSSLSNICCACNNDSAENLNDIPDNRSKFSTFFSQKSEDLCKKCGINTQSDGKFQCHLNCKCKNAPQSQFYVENDEHIYAEPFHHKTNDNSSKIEPSGSSNGLAVKKSIRPECNVSMVKKSIRTECDVIAGGSVGSVRDILGNWGNVEARSEYGVVNNAYPEGTDADVKESKIYDIPCHPSRSPSPEIHASSPIENHSFESLRRGFENISNSPRPPVVKSKSFDVPKISSEPPKIYGIGSFPKQKSLDAKNPPDIAQKPSSLPKDHSKLKLKCSSSSENLSKEFKVAKSSLEKKFPTEGARRRRFERNAAVCHGTLGQRNSSDRTRDQLDVDRENLNKLMSEIYDTVSAACKMDSGGEQDTSLDRAKPSKFPIDTESPGSEDSVRLSRSLTEKRRNYVRRVSSRVAYLEPQTRQNVRFRHQTSICSYKSENLQDQNMYATFRSWKSFKNSQMSIRNADSKTNLADSANGRTDMKRVSVDSKANLTDSRGNLLSAGDEFCSDEIDASLEDVRVDETAGCLDIDLPVGAREKGLFDICLLVGLNHMTGQAYVKSVFPKEVTVPSHIENLVFPETISSDDDKPRTRHDYDLEATSTQCYSLVLTNERGERSFGYCRRVLPEGASFCLPLAYCLITRFRAPGFYYKVLQELESHHGQSDLILDSVLQQLFDKDFPDPGDTITLTQLKSPKKSTDDLRKNSLYRNSVNLGDILKCKTLPAKKSPLKNEPGSSDCKVENHKLFESVEPLAERRKSSEMLDYYDLENNNNNRLKFSVAERTEVKVIRRPIEPRMDEDNLSVLFDSVNVNLLIKIFATLLLERKVVLMSDKLSQLSACIEGIQGLLYPLVWQQPLVTIVPAELRKDMLEAPLPMLAGLLRSGTDEWLQNITFEEGMLIDLSPKTGAKVIHQQGDEATIIPNICHKTLKTSLQLESNKNLIGTEREVDEARNVLISEAFLRFFVEVLGEFWSHFKYGRRKREPWDDGPDSDEEVVIFDKEQFTKSAASKQIQYFLEWFTETAMFNHFIQNMSLCYPTRQEMVPLEFDKIQLVDTPLPRYYEVFEDRVRRRHLLAGSNKKAVRGGEKYKSAMNKKMKLLRNKLRDLVN